jgi:hypothetical protein
MQNIIDYLLTNIVTVMAIQQSLFSGLSALCALAGWTRASKIFGTFCTLDLGRIVRYLKLFAEFVKASNRARARLVSGSILLGCSLVGCGAFAPKPTMPCAGLYCLEWSGHAAGLPGSVLVCAKTELEAQQAARTLLDRDPKSTVRKVSK